MKEKKNTDEKENGKRGGGRGGNSHSDSLTHHTTDIKS